MTKFNECAGKLVQLLFHFKFFNKSIPKAQLVRTIFVLATIYLLLFEMVQLSICPINSYFFLCLNWLYMLYYAYPILLNWLLSSLLMLVWYGISTTLYYLSGSGGRYNCKVMDSNSSCSLLTDWSGITFWTNLLRPSWGLSLVRDWFDFKYYRSNNPTRHWGLLLRLMDY